MTNDNSNNNNYDNDNNDKKKNLENAFFVTVLIHVGEFTIR